MTLQRTSAMRHVVFTSYGKQQARSLHMNEDAVHVYYFTQDPQTGAVKHYFVEVAADRSITGMPRVSCDATSVPDFRAVDLL